MALYGGMLFDFIHAHCMKDRMFCLFVFFMLACGLVSQNHCVMCRGLST